MAAGNQTVSFDDIIQASRKRKKNEELWNEIRSKGNKKSNAPGAGVLNIRKNAAQTPSLASRMGVTKVQRSSSVNPKPNINGKWGHDLHPLNNPRASRVAQLPRTASASRIELRGNRIYSELRPDQQNNTKSQANIRSNATNGAGGINIRGMAGPYTVVASNFAPGTTAADIEAVMAPIGGEMIGCRLASSHPTVIAEMIFVEKEGADNVIAMFNNKKADGRLLYVYMKGGPSHAFPKAHTRPEASVVKPDRSWEQDVMEIDDEERGRGRYEKSHNNRHAEPDYQDGRYGFSETPGMEPRRDNPRGRGRGELFSDNMVRRDQDRNYRP
ncbi:hypothetical protein K432DRAFT_377345 [Lepidopterella palustris CBS 459.81]|uniref:RRM domain-containing protein n=1 Tax=Lepidopterella palustris CBS 459.81 TaxID=1314670 RepID=A0A8E2EKT6_9PEZI|nr:hypothetical protein K432DRAFT_377345 [Lepidopterella palustris CBS 459.81]